MKFENVSVLSAAHAEAPIRVLSRDIGGRLGPLLSKYGLDEQLIENLTGIACRRYWPEGTMPSDAAAAAGEKAIAAAGIDRSRIGVLINTSVCRDFIEPSTACIAHNLLHLSPDCVNFDVGNACLGFVNGMEIAAHMIERGQVEYALIVDGEDSRFATESTIARVVEPGASLQTFRDNFATLTLGSGAAAMILTRTDLAPQPHPLVGSVTMAATEHSKLCLGQPDRMVTDAHTLLVHGLELAEKTWRKARTELGWQGDDLQLYSIHQVSGIHTDKFVELIGIDDRKVYKTYAEYGNMGPANIPFILAKALADGLVRPGDRVGLLGIGSGLNCSMMELVW